MTWLDSLPFADLGSDGRPCRLGILGGTFDPIHMAHLAFAEQAREGAHLDAVLFIPAGMPVFKLDRDIAPGADRLAMCRLAVASNPRFAVCGIEVEREGLTYTVDTLRELREAYPANVELCLITGSDTAATILKWRNAADIASLAELIVGQRPGAALSAEDVSRIEQGGFTLRLVDVSALDVSSSDLRSRICAGKSPRYLTLDAVVDYIHARCLYQSDEKGGCPMSKANAATGTVAEAEDALGCIDVLSDAFFEARKADLAGRVKPKRFRHSLGVSETAASMARTYGGDVRLARLAGLLHDWDKGYDDDGARARVDELGLTDELASYRNMPHLLHGPTAAAALKRDFPSLPAELLQAIARHTTGAPDMTDLDMIVYVADAIEPSRDYEGIDELRSSVGKASLEELFLSTFEHVLDNLVSRRKLIHPDTVIVWNHYVERARTRARR